MYICLTTPLGMLYLASHYKKPGPIRIFEGNGLLNKALFTASVITVPFCLAIDIKKTGETAMLFLKHLCPSFVCGFIAKEIIFW